MKLPWNRKYLEISFHVIITVLVIYALSLFIGKLNVVLLGLGNFIATFISLFMPLWIGIAVAFLLNPVVSFLDQKIEKSLPSRFSKPYGSTKRIKGTSAVYIIIGLLIFIAVQVIVHKAETSNVMDLADKTNSVIVEFSEFLVLIKVKLAEFGILENVDTYINDSVSKLSTYIQSIVSSVAASFSKAGNWAINLFIGLISAFYFLVNKDAIINYMKDIIKNVFPEKISKGILSVSHNINITFANYLNGQILDAIIMAILISVSLLLINVPYAILIGVISGFSNLIPYLGAIVAFVLAVSVALISGSPLQALYAAIAIVILQQVDGMFIVPKVVGKTVKIHPVLVLLSLAVFGGLFGILGMVVAVPFTALLKIYLVKLYNILKRRNNPAIYHKG